MEFKGTKGKWKIVEDDDCHSVVLIEQGWSFGRTYIAREICQGHDNGLADATLIAHAPEMLEMLNKVNDLLIRRALPTEREVNEFAKDIQDLLTRATTI